MSARSAPWSSARGRKPKRRNETQSPDPGDGSFTPIAAQQVTNSIYAEHRINLFQRLDLTLGGRVDAIEGGRTFETWRATAAYHIDETGTKLRASAGTGAKAATLYQRFSVYGTPDLAPEQSLGFDAGVDQKLFGDRLTVSATAFATRFRDLIDYGDVSSCSPTQIARISRLLLQRRPRGDAGRRTFRGGDAVAWRSARQGDLHLYRRARSRRRRRRRSRRGLQLYRIPRNKGALSLIYDGIPNLELEPRLSLVDQRLDEFFNTTSFLSQNVSLAPYAKLDFSPITRSTTISRCSAGSKT